MSWVAVLSCLVLLVLAAMVAAAAEGELRRMREKARLARQEGYDAGWLAGGKDGFARGYAQGRDDGAERERHRIVEAAKRGGMMVNDKL